eukprot:jgi/Picsp_1/301/NSC_00300-R1_rna exonuclease
MKSAQAKMVAVGTNHHVQRKPTGLGSLFPKWGHCRHLIKSMLISIVQVDQRAVESKIACRSRKNDNGTGSKTRLEEQAEQLVAIDVEYIHLTIQQSDNISNSVDLQLPAEVCLIDADGNNIFWSVIDSLSELRLSNHGMSDSGFKIVHKGGSPLEDIKGKPMLSKVRNILIENMTDRLVVGHNLAKDLTSLGIHASIPLEMRRDTMTYPCLQNEKGHGRALSHLAETKLNRVIQLDKHDSREDALATLDLYLKYCHYDETRMDYEDLVEFYLSRIIDSSDSKSEST